MKNFSINGKQIIGMLHLDYLEGKYSKGSKYVITKAIKDIRSLQNGGVDAILIENWKTEKRSEFISDKSANELRYVINSLKPHLRIPFGLNILSNDYKHALLISKSTGASFIQLDTFVDKVRMNFNFDKVIKTKSFQVNPRPKTILTWQKKTKAENIQILVFVQPKHATLLERGKTIEQSTKQAVTQGASGVIITKATGVAPTATKLKKAKKVANNIPVGVGSGLNYENLKEFFPIMDFAIVGSYFKVDGKVDNPVDPKRVALFMKKVNNLRKKQNL